MQLHHGSKMKILVADDSRVSRHLLTSIVQRWGYEVVSTPDGKGAWEILAGPEAPRIAILDWMMPGLTGPEVCRMVRANGVAPYVYLLLLTSRTQKEDVIEGLASGADDYVLKPFDHQELNVRLRAGRRIIDLQDALLGAQSALRHQANHDSLTGVKNRRRITELLEESDSWPGPLTVIMLDLDRFKLVNDTFGHAMGDAVLSTAAQCVLRELGDGDELGRYGGEEFVILTRRPLDEVAAFAERIRLAIADGARRNEALPMAVTASFGVASRVGRELAGSFLLRQADSALYEAKRGGRDRVVVSTLAAP